MFFVFATARQREAPSIFVFHYFLFVVVYAQIGDRLGKLCVRNFFFGYETRSGCDIFFGSSILSSSVSDPHHFYADPDPA
jgi:hypothetical protein